MAVAPFEMPIPSAPLPPRAPLAITLKHTQKKKTGDYGFEIFYNHIFGLSAHKMLTLLIKDPAVK